MDTCKSVRTYVNMFHYSPLDGHSGIQNTLDCLRDDFYFLGWGNLSQIMLRHVMTVNPANLRIYEQKPRLFRIVHQSEDSSHSCHID